MADAGPNISLVLFDLDGTLADTLPDLADALSRALAAAGRTAPPAHRLRAFVTRGSRAMAAAALDEPPDAPAVVEVARRMVEEYALGLAARTRPFPGVAAMLDDLEARGIAWGVVTNKPARLTDALVGHLGWSDRAACVVSPENAGHAKPAPEPVRHACRLAGHPPGASVYVGDARNDVLAGSGAGTFTLAAAWGYLEAGDDPGGWGADGVVDVPHGILAWLDAR